MKHLLKLAALFCLLGILADPARVEAQSKVNLNAASAAELSRVPGFDAQIAVRILARRAAKGPFKSFDELMEIQGINKVNLVSALDYLEIGAPPTGGSASSEAPPPAAPARKLDLNSASFPQLLLLPEMTPGAAKAIVDYRKKHGPYHSVDDLGGVPGLDKRIVLQLIDQVVVPGAVEAPAATPTPDDSLSWVNHIDGPAASEVAPAQQVDVNTADRDQLARVPGLGPQAAQRIVEFRARSGPFHDLEGLRAVRGLTQSKLAQARPFLIASEVPEPSAPVRFGSAAPPSPHPPHLTNSTPTPKAVALAPAAPAATPLATDGRVNINAAGVEDLLALPRMTREAAMELVAFRQSHGPFGDPHGITKVPTFGEAAYARLRDKISIGR